MELDERIIEGKKPLGCFDLEVAKQFIGKKCFFGASLEWFSDLDVCTFGELKCIDEETDDAFLMRYGTNYDFIIPAEWVKAEDIKYEPFKYIFELEKAGIKVGEVITFKEAENNYIYDSLVTAIRYSADGKLQVLIVGGLTYDLDELFQHYLLKVGNSWIPFGKLCSTLKPSESDSSEDDEE